MRFTPAQPRRSRRGASLLEIMTVMTLAGLVLGMIVPNIRAFRETASLDSAAHEVARDLGRARIEAVKRNQKVMFVRMSATTYQIDFAPERSLPGGVRFHEGGSAESVTFNSMGVSADGAVQFKLKSGSETRHVKVRASGHASVE
jgi:type II secretory pathway pseudopilin PulG